MQSWSIETDQPPALAFFMEGPDAPGLPPEWVHSGGRWNLMGGKAVQADTRPGELCEASLALPAASFLLKVGVQALSEEQRHPGAFGLLLLDSEGGEVFSLEFLPRTGAGQGTATGMAATGYGETRREKALPLADDFASGVRHAVWLEVSGGRARLAIDGTTCWQGGLSASPSSSVLFTRGMAAAFSEFELTVMQE